MFTYVSISFDVLHANFVLSSKQLQHTGTIILELFDMVLSVLLLLYFVSFSCSDSNLRWLRCDSLVFVSNFGTCRSFRYCFLKIVYSDFGDNVLAISINVKY